MKNKILSLMKGEIRLIDVFYFIQGMIRYHIFYSRVKGLLIRKHIREQIEYRIAVMNPLCYDRGECIECGCATTALQMCNKVCEGNCYPFMMNKKEWRNKRFNILTSIKH